MRPDALAGISTGVTSRPYTDAMNPDRPMSVRFYRPASHTPDTPVVMLFHGIRRDGTRLLESWMPAADRHGLLLVSIIFPMDTWPGREMYNDGAVLDAQKSVRPAASWAFKIPARIMALLRSGGVTAQPGAYLWGHSAGGQFVHRLLATDPHGPYQAVGAANAGWYTLPTLDRDYPAGLGGIGLTAETLAAFLGYRLILFAGDRDLKTEIKDETGLALEQGPHRFARAQKFLALGQAQAANMGVPCNWQLVVAHGVGHVGKIMSEFSGAHWFGA